MGDTFIFYNEYRGMLRVEKNKTLMISVECFFNYKFVIVVNKFHFGDYQGSNVMYINYIFNDIACTESQRFNSLYLQIKAKMYCSLLNSKRVNFIM